MEIGIISDAKDAVEMILKEGNFSNSRERTSLEKELVKLRKEKEIPEGPDPVLQ